METGITFTFAAIFLGAAILSSAALYARQPIIIAYIALGIALGPFGLGLGMAVRRNVLGPCYHRLARF